jgi:hypothetical protein
MLASNSDRSNEIRILPALNITRKTAPAREKFGMDQGYRLLKLAVFDKRANPIWLQ